MSFSKTLIEWYRENGRALPWRDSQDPYIIWLSEIILQQTRVEQGLPYFQRFVTNYPRVADFAAAPESDLLRLWQGLGYYSRARNMHKAAQQVMDKYEGQFPSSYAELITLPGIGSYTAAAISSFSANEAQAVLDGNVFRVLARYFALSEPINSSAGKKLFSALASEMLDVEDPASYNQAIMDFGALHCKPKAPLCGDCVFRLSCQALQQDLVSVLPVKTKKAAVKRRYFHYFIVQDDAQILMAQRGAGDVWTNLYEFPMVETATDVELAGLYAELAVEDLFEDPQFTPIGGPIKHVLSHQHIYAKFYRLERKDSIKQIKSNWDYFLLEKLDKLAKHKLIFSFLEKHIVYL